ncbi:MAG: Uma2 family endonuclease [Streptomycetaceae bacterium]|nr:Uma2 family endonuclease [Streptomycetaceae bacterium]
MENHYGLNEQRFRTLMRIVAAANEDPDAEGIRWEATPHGIVMLSSPDWEHLDIVVALRNWLLERVPSTVMVGENNAFVVGGGFERTPDLFLVERKLRSEHRGGHALGIGGVQMFVEVTSRATRNSDLGRTGDDDLYFPGKPRLYGDAGVPVYLIVDRKDHKIIVHSEPRPGGYRRTMIEDVGEDVTLPDPVGLVLETEFLKDYL